MISPRGETICRLSIVACTTLAIALTSLAITGPPAGSSLIAVEPAQAAKSKRISAKRRAKLFGVVAVSLPTAAEFNRMGRLGVRAVRLHLSWRAIEEKRGVRNWGYFDRLVADATAAGVMVVPQLFDVPPWIDKDRSTPPIRSKHEKAQWKGFVKEAARRYGPGGVFWTLHPELPARPITIYQVGNEPNLPFFFGGKVGVRRYRDLLKATATALRATLPNVIVVGAGIFHYRTVAGSVSMKKYLTRFYRLPKVRRWFDVMALHPYAPRPKGVIATVRGARRIMRRAHDGRTPIWITEFGWTTGGVGWRKNAFRATKRQQAKRLKHTYRLLVRNRKLRVLRAFWHSFADFDYPGQPDPWTNRMGLLTVKGGRKPSWYAYARIAGGRP